MRHPGPFDCLQGRRSGQACAGIHRAAGGAAGGDGASLAARWTPEQVRGDEEVDWFTQRREGGQSAGSWLASANPRNILGRSGILVSDQAC